jgi:RimJ/RimL family protein N-acetyltransferase
LWHSATVGAVPEPLTPVTLEGRHVRLEPLDPSHAEGLAAAAAIDRSTFSLTWVPDGVEAMRSYIDTLLVDRNNAEVLPFAQRRVDTGELVGCTRYLDPHWWRGRTGIAEVEIGGTWLASNAQRSGINTEAKLLLLTHAFEQLGVWRVAICTDARNQQSRDAILRIGATFEGILRNHRLRYDSIEPQPRQSAMYSVISEEWPEVKIGLRDRLAARP